MIGLRLDESNTEKANSLVDLGVTVTAGMSGLPQGMKPRSVTLQSDDNTIKRKCIILSAARYNALGVGTQFLLTAGTFDGVSVDTVVSVRRKNPESLLRQPYQGDTGLIDGDNP
jgi:hypothetical protein